MQAAQPALPPPSSPASSSWRVRGTSGGLDPLLRDGARPLSMSPPDARSPHRGAWDDITEAAPAVITAPSPCAFTFSIAEGIAFGFISDVENHVPTGRYSGTSSAVGILACAVS